LLDAIKHQVQHPGHGQPHGGDGEGTEASSLVDGGHGLGELVLKKSLKRNVS
jgi:hypothetical protein